MKRYIFLLLLILIPINISAAIIPHWNNGTVVSITDGDTLKIDIWNEVQTIRIIWLDTPEIYATRFGYSECYGKEASDYVKEILPIWTRVYMESYWNDKYSRWLADIYIWTKTWTLLANTIIRNGYGWVYKKWIKTQNYVNFLRSENIAKRLRIWLWNPSICNGERRLVIENISTSINYWSGISDKKIYSCKNVPKYCSGVKTRAEAQFYLHSCNAKRFDVDKDDIACENIY